GRERALPGEEEKARRPEERVARDQARAAGFEPPEHRVALQHGGDERGEREEPERPVERRAERNDESRDPSQVGDDQQGGDLAERVPVRRGGPEQRKGQ